MSSRNTGVLWVAHTQAHHQAQAQTHEPVRSAFAKTHDLTVAGTRTALLRQFASRPRVIILDGGPAPSMLLTALWARAQGIPAIVWHDGRREDESWPASGFLRRWYYRSAALVLTPSPAVTQDTVNLGVLRTHIIEGLSDRDIELFLGDAEVVIGSQARGAVHPDRPSGTARGTGRSAEVH